MRLFGRLTLIGLVVMVAAGFWLNQSQPAVKNNDTATVSEGQCASSGISVVIDYGTDSDLDLVEKCVWNYTGNSWNLLKLSGLEITGTQKYPAGFICRINNIPGPETEKCIDTPGAKNGSWAYFLAEPGSKNWTYSSFGAASRKAKCGWAEGWRFLQQSEALNTPPRAKPVTSTCEK
ncbi:MAG: hypothetical protein ACKOFA_04385 [Rhodoluna sp.]